MSVKSSIRKEMIARRNSITPEEVMERSSIIQRRVMGLPAYRDSSTIGLYANFNNEVSTSLIFNEALREGKRVLFPCMRVKEKDLVFYPVHRWDEMELGPFGIMAPLYSEEKRCSAEEAGLLLIPGVAYNPMGGRLGYGGGFYDRSMGRLRKRPFIAALAYEFQVLDEIPMHPHDVRVDAIVTEERVIICR
jgi:5-formyltetrahydrofolate cyclo-ligase